MNTEHNLNLEVPRSVPYVVTRRRRYLQSKFDIKQIRMLEIGALNMPTYLNEEAHIAFADYFTNEEILRFHENSRLSRPLDGQVNVSIVLKEKRFADCYTERYDLVIANHVIEHVADPITWIIQLSKLLAPGGYIFLAVPDRRYTFDYLRKETSALELYKRFVEDWKTPDFYTLLDFHYFQRPLKSEYFWTEADVDPETVRSIKSYSFAAAKMRSQQELHNTDGNLNVHCSVFSAPTFFELWNTLVDIGVFSDYALILRDVRDVQSKGNEFYVLIQKP